MDQVTQFLGGYADTVAVGISVGLTFVLYYFLPGPVDPLTGKKTIALTPFLDRISPTFPFFIGAIMGALLDRHVGQDLRGRVVDALATGTYALAIAAAAQKILGK